MGRKKLYLSVKKGDRFKPSIQLQIHTPTNKNTHAHTHTHVLHTYRKNTSNCFGQFEGRWVENECHYGNEKVFIPFTITLTQSLTNPHIHIHKKVV